MYRPLAGQSRV